MGTESIESAILPDSRYEHDWLSHRFSHNLKSHSNGIRELNQPRRRRQQERHKFAYLTMKNSTFARFARAFFIFGHLADVLDLSTT